MTVTRQILIQLAVRDIVGPSAIHRVMACKVTIELLRQFQEVRFPIDQHGLVPSLRQMPHSALMTVYPTSIPKREVLDDFR